MPYRTFRKTYRRKPLRKRGFGLDVKVGRNVPFFGGSSLRLGTRAVKRIARREIARQEEVKQFPCGFFADALQHNSVWTFAPTQGITKGVDANQRTGDQIFLKHVTAKMQVGNYSVGGIGNGQVKYRVLGMWLDKQYTATNTWNGLFSGVGSSDVFIGSASLVNALINNKLGAKVICDKIYTVAPSDEGKKVINLKLDCPINKKVTYSANGKYFKDEQLYFVIVPWATMPSATTNYAGQLLVDAIVTYRDA